MRDPLDVLEAVVELIEAGGPEQQRELLTYIAERYELSRPGPPRVTWSEVEKLIETSGPMSPAEVAIRLPYESRKQAQNALQELCVRGRVLRLERGLYDVPREGKS